jgi:hypothetical protein
MRPDLSAFVLVWLINDPLLNPVAPITLEYTVHCTPAVPSGSSLPSAGLARRRCPDTLRLRGANAVEHLMDKHSAIMAPLCPVCEQPMSASSMPKSKFFPLPKSRTFECKRCAVIATTTEVQLPDNEHMHH